ncbi:MAG: VWA domain-containing protein [Pseudomonadota bacterium]
MFRDRQATELFSRLRRLLSLLFQLALLALLIFALGDPRPKQSLLEGRHLVVLVDGSASMKAVDVKPNRIEAAKAEVKKLVRGLGSADRALIVQMGALSSPLSTMTSDVTELDPAIDSLSASDTRADLERGLSFAIDSLRGLPKAEVVVVSDGVLGDVAQIAQRIDLGRRLVEVPPDRQFRHERGHFRVLGAPLPARQIPLRGDARSSQHQRSSRAGRTHFAR